MTTRRCEDADHMHPGDRLLRNRQALRMCALQPVFGGGELPAFGDDVMGRFP
jgi:hypothetical protein